MLDQTNVIHNDFNPSRDCCMQRCAQYLARLVVDQPLCTAPNFIEHENAPKELIKWFEEVTNHKLALFDFACSNPDLIHEFIANSFDVGMVKPYYLLGGLSPNNILHMQVYGYNGALLYDHNEQYIHLKPYQLNEIPNYTAFVVLEND